MSWHHGAHTFLTDWRPRSFGLVIGLTATVAVLVGCTPAAAGSVSAGLRTGAGRFPSSCAALDLTSAFPAPPGAGLWKPDELITQNVPASFGQGFACQVRAVPKTSGASASPLGYFELLKVGSQTQAEALFTEVRTKIFSGASQTVAVGSQAFTTPAGGAVRVDATVFVFHWFPKVPADDHLSQLAVLKRVALLIS